MNEATKNLPLARVAIIIFISGFCSLVYQTVWFREFRLVFGASTLATSAVLAIFMAGLGVGGLVLGRRADKWRRPFWAYWQIELAITLLAAVSPFLLDGVRSLYLNLGGSSALGSFGATAIRLGLATLVIGPSVFFMGGTLPAAAKAVTGRQDVSRNGLALLYGANTLGAVLGVCLSTFLLFEFLGFRSTLWVAALLNALIAVSARAMSRKWEKKDEAELISLQGAEQVNHETALQAPPYRPWLLPAAFITGFVFFLSELVWYRLAAPILGGSTYTFGVILAVALFGIGVGGLFHSLRDDKTSPTPGLFGVTCTLQAALLLLPYAMGDRLALLAYHLNAFGDSSFIQLSLGWVIVAAVMVLPSAVIAGYQFPLMFALKGQAKEGIATDTGQIYAANTAGAIVGALAGGFGLIPLLGSSGAWIFAAALLLLLGVFLIVATFRREPFRAGLSLTLAASAVLFAFAQGPTAVWKHTAIGAGRASLSTSSKNAWTERTHSIRSYIAEEYDGVESTLGFGTSNGLSLLVNGKSDGNALYDAITQIFLGLAPALIHGHPESAFVIGLGTGETAGWLAEVPSVDYVEVAEIEPKVVRFAELAAVANHNMTENEKVTIRIGDGREMLITAQRGFDLIVSEPSNPYRAGIASFYSQEFYELAAQKLNENGLFAQWVQLYEIDPEAVRTIVATMNQVFPNISFWQLSAGDLLLVGSLRPQVINTQNLDRLIGQEPFAEALNEVVRIYDAEGFLALHLANEKFTPLLSHDSALINRDDEPALEYMFARGVGQTSASSQIKEDILTLAFERGWDKPTVTNPEAIEWDRVEALRTRPYLYTTTSYPDLPLTEESQEAEADKAFWNAYLPGNIDQAYELIDDLTVQDDDLYTQYIVLETLVRHAPEENAREIQEAMETLENTRYAPEVNALRLYLAFGAEDTTRINALWPEFLEDMRTEPWMVSSSQWLVLNAFEDFQPEPELAQEMIDQLLEAPFAAYKLESTRRNTLLQLARTLQNGGPIAGCTKVFEALEPHVGWTENFLTQRYLCYGAHNHPLAEKATNDLTQFKLQRGFPLPMLIRGDGVHVLYTDKAVE